MLSYHVFLSSSGMYSLNRTISWGGGDGGLSVGRLLSQVRLTLPVAVSPEPVPDTFRWLSAMQRLC